MHGSMTLLLLPVLAVAACTGTPPDREGGSEGSGRFEVTWDGWVKGRIRVDLTGSVCTDDRLVEMLAYKGDVGAGVSLYSLDAVIPARYPIFDPLLLDPPRPGSAMALRWFAETTLIGMEGYGGWVEVESVAGDTISGRFEVQLRNLEHSDTVIATGTFRNVPLAVESTCHVRRN